MLSYPKVYCLVNIEITCPLVHSKYTMYSYYDEYKENAIATPFILKLKTFFPILILIRSIQISLVVKMLITKLKRVVLKVGCLFKIGAIYWVNGLCLA